MSAADPHTDDLPDRLDEMAVDGGNPFDLRLNMTYAERENLRAAAAELRRLRHTVGTLTTLLDAMGDPRYVANMYGVHAMRLYLHNIADRIAAAVEALDGEGL